MQFVLLLTCFYQHFKYAKFSSFLFLYLYSLFVIVFECVFVLPVHNMVQSVWLKNDAFQSSRLSFSVFLLYFWFLYFMSVGNHVNLYSICIRPYKKKNSRQRWRCWRQSERFSIRNVWTKPFLAPCLPWNIRLMALFYCIENLILRFVEYMTE